MSLSDDADLHGADCIADERREERIAAGAHEWSRDGEKGVTCTDGIDCLVDQRRNSMQHSVVLGNKTTELAVSDDEISALYLPLQLFAYNPLDRRVAIGNG